MIKGMVAVRLGGSLWKDDLQTALRAAPQGAKARMRSPDFVR